MASRRMGPIALCTLHNSMGDWRFGKDAHTHEGDLTTSMESIASPSELELGAACYTMRDFVRQQVYRQTSWRVRSGGVDVEGTKVCKKAGSCRMCWRTDCTEVVNRSAHGFDV